MHILRLAFGLLLAGGCVLASGSWATAQSPQRWRTAPEMSPQVASRQPRSSGPISHAIHRHQQESVLTEDVRPGYASESYGNSGCCDSGCCDDACGACDCCGSCDPCRCHCGHWLVLGEMTFFRYHRADGVRVGSSPHDGEDAPFDFEVAPRVTLGYAGADGLGFRVRWWDFDHKQFADDHDSWFGVETYTIDFELFDTVQLSSNWTLQLSGGGRWNEFDEQLVDQHEDVLRLNLFRGFGGLVGAEVRRCIGPCSALFMSTRLAVLMDDKYVTNGGYEDRIRLLDSVQGMIELSLGYELTLSLECNTQLFARFAGEWQNWYNYSSAFPALGDENYFTGASDVGFGGFSVAIGICH